MMVNLADMVTSRHEKSPCASEMLFLAAHKPPQTDFQKGVAVHLLTTARLELSFVHTDAAFVLVRDLDAAIARFLVAHDDLVVLCSFFLNIGQLAGSVFGSPNPNIDLGYLSTIMEQCAKYCSDVRSPTDLERGFLSWCLAKSLAKVAFLLGQITVDVEILANCDLARLWLMHAFSAVQANRRTLWRPTSLRKKRLKRVPAFAVKNRLSLCTRAETPVTNDERTFSVEAPPQERAPPVSAEEIGEQPSVPTEACEQPPVEEIVPPVPAEEISEQPSLQGLVTVPTEACEQPPVEEPAPAEDVSEHPSPKELVEGPPVPTEACEQPLPQEPVPAENVSEHPPPKELVERLPEQPPFQSQVEPPPVQAERSVWMTVTNGKALPTCIDESKLTPAVMPVASLPKEPAVLPPKPKKPRRKKPKPQQPKEEQKTEDIDTILRECAVPPPQGPRPHAVLTALQKSKLQEALTFLMRYFTENHPKSVPQPTPGILQMCNEFHNKRVFVCKDSTNTPPEIYANALPIVAALIVMRHNLKSIDDFWAAVIQLVFCDQIQKVKAALLFLTLDKCLKRTEAFEKYIEVAVIDPLERYYSTGNLADNRACLFLAMTCTFKCKKQPGCENQTCMFVRTEKIMLEHNFKKLLQIK